MALPVCHKKNKGIRKMKVTASRVLLGFAATLLCASSAVAGDSYFDFSFSGSGYSGGGVLGGVSVGGGDYFINYVSGTDNGAALSLLPTATIWTGSPACIPGNPCYTAGPYVFNDVLYASASGLMLDPDGLGLSTAVNGAINIIGYGSGYSYSDANSTGSGKYVPISFSASPVTSAPEIDPTSAATDVTLLIGSLVVLRGRRTLKLAAAV
jgi:hypothetical protein